MEVEFDYRKEPSGLFGNIGRPVARIVLISGARQVPEVFYVDSGADITLIPRSVGELLGLSLPTSREITEIKGIGEKGLPIVVKKVKLRIRDFTFSARVGWCLIEDVPLLLGRVDVFRLFTIIFKKDRTTSFFR